MKTVLASMFVLSTLAGSASAYEIGEPTPAYYAAYSHGAGHFLGHGHHGHASWGYPPYTGCFECGPGWTRGMEAWSGFCEGDCHKGCGRNGCSPAHNHGSSLCPFGRLDLFGHDGCHHECQGGLLGDCRPFAWLASLFHPKRDNDYNEHCCIIGYPGMIEDECQICSHGGMMHDQQIDPIPAERILPIEPTPENIQPGPRRQNLGPGPTSAYEPAKYEGAPRLLPFISYAQELGQ